MAKKSKPVYIANDLHKKLKMEAIRRNISLTVLVEEFLKKGEGR